MRVRWRGAGRGIPRPALFGGAGLILGVLVWVVASTAAGPRRGPATLPNPEARRPNEFRVGSVRHIVAPDAAERLVPDTVFPTLPVRLLWFEGRVARPLAWGGAVTLDGMGGVIWFDRRLGLHRWPASLPSREIVSVAGAAGDILWLAGADGSVTRLGRDGSAREISSRQSLDLSGLAADPADPHGAVWLVRHPLRWQYRLPDPTAPLLVRLDSAGTIVARVGKLVVPPQVLLAEFASAGHVTVAGDTVYYAPFIRDEIIAFSATGDTLWVTGRELPQSTPDPSFGMQDGEPVIDYHPVNLGATIGPDGRLYVLSTAGFTTTESRLDVFDRATGRLMASALLSTAVPTLAADDQGRVYLIDTFRLLTGIRPEEREPFRPFDLPRLGGGRVSLGDLRGKVSVINFWASWCTPCREEMPALDRLRRALEKHPDFRFLTMNEDVDVGDAAAFVREFGFTFPVLLGRGQLRREYHYLGLPMTVLLDREARVVEHWSGFAGPKQIGAIELLVRKELERGSATTDEHAGHPRH